MEKMRAQSHIGPFELEPNHFDGNAELERNGFIAERGARARSHHPPLQLRKRIDRVPQHRLNVMCIDRLLGGCLALSHAWECVIGARRIILDSPYIFFMTYGIEGPIPNRGDEVER